MAKDNKANYFDLGKGAEAKYGKTEVTGANALWLDEQIAQGNRFLLSSKYDDATGTFLDELKYLEAHEYELQIIDSQEWMVKKGG